MTYVITEPCIDVKDRSCIEECPVDCIYEGDRMLYIHPDECVDCGACEPVCPVEAIFYEDDVPAQWKDFTATNSAFFTEGEDPLGSPGGAAKSALVLRDASRRHYQSQDLSDGLRLHAAGLGPAAVGSVGSAARPGESKRMRHAGACLDRREGQLAADVGHLDPVGGGGRRGAQLGVAVAASSPDAGQRRAEVVVVAALAQERPQVVPGASEQAGVELAVGRQARAGASRGNGWVTRRSRRLPCPRGIASGGDLAR